MAADDPDLDAILEAHGIVTTAARGAAREWSTPLDSTRPALPADHAGSFKAGYDANRPWLIHRSFKLWKDALRNKSTTQAPTRGPPSLGLFAFPGSEVNRAAITSLDDLDGANQQRLKMVRVAADLWGFHVLIVRVRARWCGEADACPFPYQGKKDAAAASSSQSDDAKPPPARSVLEAMFHPPPCFSSVESDYAVGVAEMRDVDGGLVVPRLCSVYEGNRIAVGWNEFISPAGFFYLAPDEVVKQAKRRPGGEKPVRLGWERDVSNPHCGFY